MILELARVQNPEKVAKVEASYELIMQRPFPNEVIITQLLSKTFPAMEQEELYSLVQAIKASISRQEMNCNLAKQNPHAN